MAFNCEFIGEIRKKDSISRTTLASLLGISETYLYMLEKGKKDPSLRLLKKIAEIIGVPVKKLLKEETETEEEIEMHDGVSTLVDLRNKLENERRARLKAERYTLDLERKTEHLEALIGLHIRFEDIICDNSLSESEKMGKLEELAKTAAGESELAFNEILAVLRVGRSILRKWLHVEKHAYTCRFVRGRKIMASNPGEAALRLRCFDCEDFESKKCKGHGDEKRPENIIELIDRLKVHGVLNRIEQVRILEECYHLPLSPHELAEALYRGKRGLPIAEGIYYMDNTGRRG
jgi:transcriptional regulator with XRE-family HTH domain